MIKISIHNDFGGKEIHEISAISYLNIDSFESVCLLAGDALVAERPYGMWSNFGQTMPASQGNKTERLS